MNDVPILIAETPAPVPRKRGRPRKHANNAVKQKQYRLRKQGPTRRELLIRISNRVPRRERPALAYELDGRTFRYLKWLNKITGRKLTRR